MATEAIVGDFSAPEPRERRHHDHPSHRVLQLRAHDRLRRLHLRLQGPPDGEPISCSTRSFWLAASLAKY